MARPRVPFSASKPMRNYVFEDNDDHDDAAQNKEDDFENE